MKKPNLRSFKGPNRAKKYAEAMAKYRKAQRAIVKSPGGKAVSYTHLTLPTILLV